MAGDVPAHEQKVTRSYVVTYPEHGPRAGDVHYKDFRAFKDNRKAAGTYHCDWAIEHRAGDFSECDLIAPLEAHHSHIEWALLNEVDITLLDVQYPGLSNADEVGAWVESAQNLELLCVNHHRRHMGKHVAAYADFEGLSFVRNLLS